MAIGNSDSKVPQWSASQELYALTRAVAPTYWKTMIRGRHMGQGLITDGPISVEFRTTLITMRIHIMQSSTKVNGPKADSYSEVANFNNIGLKNPKQPTSHMTFMLLFS